ncbi:MAG: helix-turn-helix domain-containing protein [Lentisphaerae bacterium]|nr:helix-turn-helix domain-containing protein [Lentisphaerota bacterium]
MLIMEDRWLSLKEITEYLGIRRETVYRWIEQREMPGHRIGKLWKFKKDEVDAWVKSGKAADVEESK